VTPVAGVYHPISIVRMAVEDAYGAEQWREGAEGAPDEVAFRTERITRSTCRAVAAYAFRTAGKMGGKVYGGPKWTVSPVYEGMLKEELDRAAAAAREVPYQPVLIDATYAGLVSGAADSPLVIPRLNRDGDCLSDLVMPMFGSIAGAESVLWPSTTTSTPTWPWPRPARDRAGAARQGHRQPDGDAAGLRGGAAPRRHQGTPGRRARLAGDLRGVLEATAAGVRTPDLGGAATTSGFTTEVVERVRTKIDVWASLGLGRSEPASARGRCSLPRPDPPSPSRICGAGRRPRRSVRRRA
jgi:hypothetical protein